MAINIKIQNFIAMKKLLSSFILGVFALNIFAQVTEPEKPGQTDYLALPLLGELEFVPPISFAYKTTFGSDTILGPPPDSIGTLGIITKIHPLLNLTKGNVGIGTTSPNANLHVVGDGLFSGWLTVGSSSPVSSSLYKIKLQIGDTWTFSDLLRAKIMGYNCRFWDQNPDVGRIIEGNASSAMMMNQDGSINLCTASSGSQLPENWNYFTMLDNGNVGIGTTNPTQKLHIAGNSYFNGNVYVQNGNFGIGTNSPTQKLHVAGNSYFNGNVGIGTTDPIKKLHVQGDTHLSGNVGIGTTNTYDYKLAVKGTIGAEKVMLEKTTNWPDYVFELDYDLMSISELEEFINRNKHLPNIPNKEEVYKNGQDIGDINRLLLEKIEELTLYIIQQQKEIDELKKR